MTPIVNEVATPPVPWYAKLASAWQWPKIVWAWWLQSAWSFLFSLFCLAAIRFGVLRRVHAVLTKAMQILLQEEAATERKFHQSIVSALEVPLECLFVINLFCHAATCVSMLARSDNIVQAVAYYADKLLNLSMKVCAGLFFMGVINVMIMRSSRGIAVKTDVLGAETSRRESQLYAMGQSARVLVVVVTFLSCLPVFHVDLSTVLSFCGMGGLAISLISKRVLSNLIGSLTIYLTQPFTLGDWIQTEDGEVDGWVYSMGPYHTVVMRWDRRPVYIPNSRFTQVQIINAGRMTNRRILMDLKVRFADLDKIDSIRDDVNQLIQNHKQLDPEQHRLVRLRRIDDYAAVIWVSCYTKGISLREFLEVKENVFLRIKDIFLKHGTMFANSLDRESRKVMDPAGDGAGEEEEVMRRQPLRDASQKAELASELRNLKQMQERNWERERVLKEGEEALEARKKELELDQETLRLKAAEIEDKRGKLTKQLDDMNAFEGRLHEDEARVDTYMTKLQKEEARLDTLMREILEKTTVSADEMAMQHMQREQAARAAIKQQEKISLEKQTVEQERELFEKDRAKAMALAQEAGSEDGSALGPTAPTSFPDGGPQKSPSGEEEEAVRLQRIAERAESLGGE